MKNRWQRTPAIIRKPVIAVAGFMIIVAGIAMLILPGPGWLTIFIGLAVLATEFTVAERMKNTASKHVKKAATAAANRLRKK